jgi:hypothetical protein
MSETGEQNAQPQRARPRKKSRPEARPDDRPLSEGGRVIVVGGDYLARRTPDERYAMVNGTTHMEATVRKRNVVLADATAPANRPDRKADTATGRFISGGAQYNIGERVLAVAEGRVLGPKVLSRLSRRPCSRFIAPKS